MAIYHLSAQVIGRSAGRSAVAAAAYRSAEKIESRTTGQVFDYAPKHDNVHQHKLMLPENAPGWAKDRGELWNRVEEKENRVNSQFCREINLALPAELPLRKQKELLEKFISQYMTSKGFAADYSIHSPDKGGDNRNQHAHIMHGVRRFDPEQEDGWSKNKARELDDRGWLRELRKGWELAVNEYLLPLGIEPVSCESLVNQGITDREPQRHMGVTATAMKRKGKTIDRTVGGQSVPELDIAEDLKKSLEGNPEYMEIYSRSFLANIDPKEWHETESKFIKSERYNEANAYIRAVLEWIPNRSKFFKESNTKIRDLLAELEGQEPKQKTMAKIFQEDYAKYEKQYNEWRDKYNSNVDTFNQQKEGIKEIDHLLETKDKKEIFDYAQKHITHKNATDWLDRRKNELLETDPEFKQYRDHKRWFSEIDPLQKEALREIKKQEISVKKENGIKKEKDTGWGY